MDPPESLKRTTTAPTKKKTELNVLLIGETGTGKSTFINGFVNFVTYSSLFEAKAGELKFCVPSHFDFVNDDYEATKVIVGAETADEVMKDGQSSTQNAFAYEFEFEEVRLRLIDTPGIGDCRGAAQDKENAKRIVEHLKNYTHLNGICILLKPNMPKLTLSFQYVLLELLKQLHRTAAQNIVFCFTNSRQTLYKPGDTLAPLREFLKKLREQWNVDIPVSKNTMFCFDNEPFRFLAAAHQGVHFPEEVEHNFEQSWQITRAEVWRLLQRLSELTPHQTVETLSIFQARSLLLSLAEPVAHITAVLNKNMLRSEKMRKEIESGKLTLRQLSAQQKRKVVVTKVRNLGFPRTVCTLCGFDVRGSYKEWRQLCHEHCHLDSVAPSKTDEPQLQTCSAMKNGICKVCNHEWRVHMHVVYELYDAEEEKEDANVVAALNSQKQEQQALVDIAHGLNLEIFRMKQEQAVIRRTNARFARFLKDNAITPYNDVLIDYLKLQINLERESSLDLSEASQMLIQQLEQDLLNYEEEVRVIDQTLASNPDAVACRLEEIDDMLQTLYALPYSGPNLRAVLARITSIKMQNQPKTFEKSRRVCEVPKKHSFLRLLSSGANWTRDKFTGLLSAGSEDRQTQVRDQSNSQGQGDVQQSKEERLQEGAIESINTVNTPPPPLPPRPAAVAHEAGDGEDEDPPVLLANYRTTLQGTSNQNTQSIMSILQTKIHARRADLMEEEEQGSDGEWSLEDGA